MDFKEQLHFPIKRIVIHIKYRDTYSLVEKVYRYTPSENNVIFNEMTMRSTFY
jgi:hypothetical protein